MEDSDFDHALITAVFAQAALRGWSDISIADAARSAGLPLGRVRARFPGRAAILLRFGIIADQAALAGGTREENPRERLFDIVMSRFDALQQHRGGVLALLRALRTDPGTSLLLYGATLRSMKWLLDAAGIPASGVVGGLRVHGLLALWLYALRAWEGDDSPDLSATMAAVDRGLDRALQAEGMLPGHSAPAAEMDEPMDVSPAAAAAEVFEDAGMFEEDGMTGSGEAEPPRTLPPPAAPEPPASPPV